jgi:hypothetical protein
MNTPRAPIRRWKGQLVATLVTTIAGGSVLVRTVFEAGILRLTGLGMGASYPRDATARLTQSSGCN